MRSELVALAEEIGKRITMASPRIAVLATFAGAFVTLGSLLSVLLSARVTIEGPIQHKPFGRRCVGCWREGYGR